jgi:hypothetical protein
LTLCSPGERNRQRDWAILRGFKKKKQKKKKKNMRPNPILPSDTIVA